MTNYCSEEKNKKSIGCKVVNFLNDSYKFMYKDISRDIKKAFYNPPKRKNKTITSKKVKNKKEGGGVHLTYNPMSPLEIPGSGGLAFDLD